jgi:CsoR family transcriptional regulator, copper-sensing transcriptional repressor
MAMVGEGSEESEREAQQIRDRLRRIEGQIRGINRMIDEGRPCVDVVTQVVAARTALDRVAEAVITSHVEECLATMDPEDARLAIGQAVRLLSRVQS